MIALRLHCQIPLNAQKKIVRSQLRRGIPKALFDLGLHLFSEKLGPCTNNEIYFIPTFRIARLIHNVKAQSGSCSHVRVYVTLLQQCPK